MAAPIFIGKKAGEGDTKIHTCRKRRDEKQEKKGTFQSHRLMIVLYKKRFCYYNTFYMLFICFFLQFLVFGHKVG